ncbi:hypothetical protein IBX38_06015 [Candidatus Bathyarchaeota archaeon]|nr:hypothetical protein [Candidatus Bathyarchaeota archaeon]
MSKEREESYGEEEFVANLETLAKKRLTMEDAADILDVELKYVKEYTKRYGINFVPSKRKKAKRKKSKAKPSREEIDRIQKLKQIGLTEDQIKRSLEVAVNEKVSPMEAARKLGFIRSGESSRRIADDSYFSYANMEIEKTRTEIEQKFFDFLKVINRETLQLSEFLVEENKLSHELCKLLKNILKRLNASFNIPPEAIPELKETKEIILNAEGHLIIISDKGEVDSKVLEDYPPDVILMVFCSVIPKLGRLVELYRKKISLRVNFFEKTYRELDNLYRAFATSEQKKAEDRLEIDKTKKLLLTSAS